MKTLDFIEKLLSIGLGLWLIFGDSAKLRGKPKRAALPTWAVVLPETRMEQP